jgi:prostaglandin-endoperoxide synthase 2
MATCRVLALDGGGIRGLLTVAILRRLSREPGLASFLDSVDLIAGTSSGGLIALALAHGLGGSTTLDTLERIEQVFIQGRQTFGYDLPVWLGGQVFWSKFGTRARQRSFRAALGDRTLGDLQKRVLIATFDLDDEGRGMGPHAGLRRWRPKLFHNFEGVNSDRDRLAWKVALYTTAGPTYFPSVDGYIDGGVYSNNPSMCALAQLFDARYPPTRRLDDIVLLSVGAGLNLKYIRGRRKNWGFLRWGLPFVGITGDGTVGIADYQCAQLLGPARYRRIEPTFSPRAPFEIDDLDRIAELREFAEAVDIKQDAKWIQDSWMPGTNLAPARATSPASAVHATVPAYIASQAPAATPERPSSRDVSRDGCKNRLVFYSLTHFRPFWRALQSMAATERLVNSLLIKIAVEYAPGRPHPLSTRAPYTSWVSLTDRTFYGRHLPPAAPRSLPAVDRVAKLFERPPGGARESRKSTALFPYFAQWFIDGVLRTDFNVYPERTIKNTSSHEIDLCNLYGRSEQQTAMLREGRGGRLKSQSLRREEFPPFYFLHDAAGHPVLDAGGELIPAFDASLAPLLPPKKGLPLGQRRYLFAMGGERANVTPGYAMMNVLFLREHNRVARVLEASYPSWDDERLFQTTRNILIVMVLKIVVEDYINHIAPYHFKFKLAPGRRIKQAWHRPNWVAIEFNLLYRWHSLMPDQMDFVDAKLDTAQALFRNQPLIEHGLGKAFAGANRQKSGEIGLFNTLPFLVADTEVPSVAMGRRAALGSYNDYRELCSFPRVSSVDQISSNPDVRDGLRSVYGHVDDIELYAGLFAEDLRPNSALPPLMGRMVGIDAFSQALTNPLISDRLFNEQTFSAVGLRLIDETSTLNDVVARNVPDAPPVSFTHASFRRT